MNGFNPQPLAKLAWIWLHFQEGQESQAGSVLEKIWFYFSMCVCACMPGLMVGFKDKMVFPLLYTGIM